jgi:diketogulonate reductase-like aldo/keto reductase
MHVTIEAIRNILQDRTPEDNSIENDLFFSDEEIVDAMKRTASAYNAMAPLGVDVVNYRALPAGTSVFTDGVIANLYKAAINKIARNLITWSTGSTNIDIYKSRIDAFKALHQMYEESFRTAGKERKLEINRSLAYGYY